MPRPRKRCNIASAPPSVFYKPQGVPLGQLRGVVLPADGLEAMRLVDAEGLSQEQAAQHMGVSRPTVCRILAEARSQVARALANGWAIRIEDRPEPEQGRWPGGKDPDQVHSARRGRGHGCGRGCRDNSATWALETTEES